MVKKQAQRNPKNNILNKYPWEVRNQHLLPDSSSDEDSESEGDKQEPYIPSPTEKELLKQKHELIVKMDASQKQEVEVN